MTLCRHCNRTVARRPRGLCSHCYNTVRDLYPSASKFSRRGVDAATRPPDAPTDARPGTPEKVAALERRAALGQHLWHDNDATEPPDAQSHP